MNDILFNEIEKNLLEQMSNNKLLNCCQEDKIELILNNPNKIIEEYEIYCLDYIDDNLYKKFCKLIEIIVDKNEYNYFFENSELIYNNIIISIRQYQIDNTTLNLTYLKDKVDQDDLNIIKNLFDFLIIKEYEVWRFIDENTKLFLYKGSLNNCIIFVDKYLLCKINYLNSDIGTYYDKIFILKNINYFKCTPEYKCVKQYLNEYNNSKKINYYNCNIL